MNWSLIFTCDEEPDIPPGAIRIIPTNSNWNDFSYNFNSLISINSHDNRRRISIPAYVVPLAGSSPNNLLRWIEGNSRLLRHDGAGNTATAPRGNLLFATLIGNEQSYSDLAKWARNGSELRSILLALNDIVLLRNSSFSSDIGKLLLGRPFVLGVLRSPAAYRAMRRGMRFFEGRQIEDQPETRKNFTFRAQLHGFDDGMHDFSVEFYDVGVFEDRLHCLIGVNGTGKTRLLRELVLSLGRLSGEAGHTVNPFAEPSEAMSDCEYEGQLYNRLLVFSTTPEYRFPLRAEHEGNFEYQYFNLVEVARSGSYKNVQNSLTLLMVDLIRDKTPFQGASLTRITLLERTLRGHIDLDKLYLPVLSDVAQDSSSYEDEHGEYYVRARDVLRMNEERHLSFTSAVDTARSLEFFEQTGERNQIRRLHHSSGQLIFFRFALWLISSIDQGTLVIVDEPETHLHPNLICEFVTLLYTVLAATKSIALIATHSAYVVREVPTHCAHVFSFEEESKRVNIGKVRMKTLGASIDSISQTIFGDSTAKKYHEKFARDLSKIGMSSEQLLSKYKSVLSPELLIEIRAMQSEGAN